MPRVHSHKARTDLYEQGKRIKDPKTKSGYRIDRTKPANKSDEIFCKKGQTYYTWKFRHGGERRSTTYPKPSQLTQSGYLRQLYDLQDRLGSATDGVSDASDLQTVVDDIKNDLEELKEETQSSLDNMPEHLQDTSSSGELLRERVEALENAISEIESLSLDDFDEDEGTEEALEEWLSEKQSELDNISLE